MAGFVGVYCHGEVDYVCVCVVQIEKMQKKQMKREKQEKAAIDQKRTADVLLFQCTLDSLGNDTVREHFKTGKHGAVVCAMLLSDL